MINKRLMSFLVEALANTLPDLAILAGRQDSQRFGMQVNMIHMAAIGLAVGLVIVLDNPFRGQTSINADIIGTALGS
jgi:hypothetical protein